jgi:hypothetical protein
MTQSGRSLNNLGSSSQTFGFLPALIGFGLSPGDGSKKRREISEQSFCNARRIAAEGVCGGGICRLRTTDCANMKHENYNSPTPQSCLSSGGDELSAIRRIAGDEGDGEDD